MRPFQWRRAPSAGFVERRAHARVVVSSPVRSFARMRRLLAISAALIAAGIVVVAVVPAPYKIVTSIVVLLAANLVALTSILRGRTRAFRGLAQSRAQYLATGESIPFGVWAGLPTGEITEISASYAALFGKCPDDLRGFGWTATYGTSSEGVLDQYLARTKSGNPFEFESEIAAYDGKRYTILTRGAPVIRDGAITGWAGINLDITERTRTQREAITAESRYRYLADSIPQIVWICNASGVVEYFNDRWFEFSGTDREGVISGRFSERIHPDDIENSFLSWLHTNPPAGAEYEREYRLRRADGAYRWFLGRAIVQRDVDGNILRWFGTSTDIDEQKRALAQLRFLAEATDTLGASLDVTTTCRSLARLAVPSIADWCGVFLLGEDDSIVTMALEHEDPAQVEYLSSIERRHPRALDSTSKVSETMRTRTPILITYSKEVVREITGSEEYAAAIEMFGWRSAIYAPMIAGGRTIGAICLIYANSGRRYEADDVLVAQELARRAASAIENALAFDREHRVADALQAAFLPPTLPRVPGLSFDAVYRPGMLDASIGGDWYDAFQLNDGRIVLSIGDVAGRGLKAAVIMGKVREAFRAFALQDLAPDEILIAAERVLRLSENTTMVTAVVGILDPIGGSFTFASAGHPPPLLAHADGTVETLDLEGIPLGLFDYHEPKMRTVAIEDDALLVLYTDGLIEYDRDVIAGIAKLKEAAISVVSRRANQAHAIESRVLASPANDDVAILTVARLRVRREPLEIELPALPESARLVRAGLERYAVAYGLDRDEHFALEVAVGEAVANVIEHAYGIDSGRLHVRAEEDEAGLHVIVRDTGHWRPEREEGRGRGLPLMKALGTEVDVDTGPGGTTVRLTFPRKAHEMPARETLETTR